MRTRFTSPARKFGAGVAASALIAGTFGLAGSAVAAAQPVENEATDTNDAIVTALADYLDAANAFDYEAFAAATCEPEVEFMNALIAKLMNGADLQTVWDRAAEVRGDDVPQIDILSVEDVIIDGDTATATVTTQVDEREPATEEVQLILDEETWKVCPDRSDINFADDEDDEDADAPADAPAGGAVAPDAE